MTARFLPEQPELPDAGRSARPSTCDRAGACGRTCSCPICFCPACTERERRALHLRPVLERHFPVPAQTTLELESSPA